MKSGTAYAARFENAYAKHRSHASVPEVPESVEPLRALGEGVVGVACGEEQARRAIDNLLSTMVDWNEARVSSASEVHGALGGAVPDGLRCSQRLLAALRAVYERENQMSLDRLETMGRREARQYLEELEGVDEYATASAFLWGLGGHGIPVNDRLLEKLRKADLVHANATRAEVQAFLERHVAASDTKEFCIVMRSFSVPTEGTGKQAKPSTSKKKKKKAVG